VEQGTHKNLMVQPDGLYQKLSHLQAVPILSDAYF